MPPKKPVDSEPDSPDDALSESEQEEQPVAPVKKTRAPRKTQPKAAKADKVPVKRRTKAQIAADEAAKELGPCAELIINTSASETQAQNEKPDPQDDPQDELSLADLQALIKAQVNRQATQVSPAGVLNDEQPVAPMVKKPRGRPRKNPLPVQQSAGVSALNSLGENKEIIEHVKMLSKLVLENGQQYRAINERLEQLTKSEDQAMKKQMADDVAKTRMFFQNLHKK